MKKTRLIPIIAVSGLFFILDQALKLFARTHQDFSFYLIRPWLGWEYYENPGIAFSLPVPNSVLLIVTPLILVFFFQFVMRNHHRMTWKERGASALLIGGALSNYADRAFFGVTIDYLRIATSIINIADIMIAAGILVFLYKKSRFSKQKNRLFGAM